jgi:hypothetical protein
MEKTNGACEEGLKPAGKLFDRLTWPLENVPILNQNLFGKKVSLIPFSTHNQKVHLFLEK